MEKLQAEMIYFGPWIERVPFTALSSFVSGPMVRQKVMVDVTRQKMKEMVGDTHLISGTDGREKNIGRKGMVTFPITQADRKLTM